MNCQSLLSDDLGVLQAAGAGETAIDLCILVARLPVLWEEVYPRFAQRGLQGLLLERLLPHLLASRLPSLPPEVMQVSLCNSGSALLTANTWRLYLSVLI